MKLEKFTKNKKQKQIVIGSIVGILLLIGGVTLYRTFALYKVEQSFDVLNGTVPDFSNGDITLAFTVNEKKESGVAFPNKNEGFKVEKVTCENGVTAGWDDENWSLTYIKNPNSESKIKCTINFKRYEESILNGSYPVLKDGLVPVKIDENTGKVTKADITQEWYKYGSKQWANAVILVDGVKEPKAGDQIDESQIESYFVWIPKYSYRLFDMGIYTTANGQLDEAKQNKAVEIQFGLENTTDTETSCATPMLSGESGTCKEKKWMTHPAFIAFENSKGFWVGKFETGYKQTENLSDITSWSKADAQQDIYDSTKVIIKPNVYSWRSIKVGNIYKTSFYYQRELDSHMMKNTEWGAVAYLTQSIYGRCDDEKCTEVRLNNNNNYITGFAAKDIPTLGTNFYNDVESVNSGEDGNKTYNYKNFSSTMASTTENYTGIYDMSGGNWEYVAGVMTSADSVKDIKKENIQYGQSELKADDITDLKYVDLYISGIDSEYDRRILGDATGEMGPFNYSSRQISSLYEDFAYFINTNLTWFQRGGYAADGIYAGLSAFYGLGGNERIINSFRIVLTP